MLEKCPNASEILDIFAVEAKRAGFTVFDLPDPPKNAYHTDLTHLHGRNAIDFYEQCFNKYGL